MSNDITLPTNKQIHHAIKLLVDVLNHHIKREKQLARLCYQRFTQQEIANYLGITKQAVSLQYPKRNTNSLKEAGK